MPKKDAMRGKFYALERGFRTLAMEYKGLYVTSNMPPDFLKMLRVSICPLTAATTVAGGKTERIEMK